MSVLPVLPLSKLPTLDMNPPPLDEVAGGLLELERFAKRPSPAGRGEGLSGYRNTQLRSEQTTRSRWATRSDTPFAQLYGHSARSLGALQSNVPANRWSLPHSVSDARSSLRANRTRRPRTGHTLPAAEKGSSYRTSPWPAAEALCHRAPLRPAHATVAQCMYCSFARMGHQTALGTAAPSQASTHRLQCQTG